MKKKEWFTPTIVNLNGKILTGVAYFAGPENYATGSCVSSACVTNITDSYTSGSNFPAVGPTQVAGTCTVSGAACS